MTFLDRQLSAPRSPTMPDNLLVSLPGALHAIPMATEFRGSVIAASQKSLRDIGRFEDYCKLLTRHHDELLYGCPAEWMPMSVAEAHYEAANDLGLTPEEQTARGADVAKFSQGTFLSTMIKLARGSGVTPWLGLEQFDKICGRVWRGGAGVTVTRRGPKEVRIRIVRLGLSRIPYYRHAFAGMLTSGGGLFSKKCYVREIPEYCTETGMGWIGSWV